MLQVIDPRFYGVVETLLSLKDEFPEQYMVFHAVHWIWIE
jgi:hypothetical protein